MTHFLIHVCFPVHTTWLHFTYSLGYFLTTLDLHAQIPEFEMKWTLPRKIDFSCGASGSAVRLFPTGHLFTSLRDSHFADREHHLVFNTL